MKILIEQIKIEARQRVDLGDIAGLASKLKEFGLLQPILLSKEADGYHLVDGFRRLSAAKTLGWLEIECYVREELSETQKQFMELYADTVRKDRTWQERCLVYLKLHRLHKSADPNWRKELLAELLGKSIGHVGECLQVAKYLEQAQGKEDEFSKALWSQPGILSAVQFLLGKNVEKATAELERRRQAILRDPAKAEVLLQGEAPAPTSSFSEASLGEDLKSIEPPVHVQKIYDGIPPEKCDCYLSFLTGEDSKSKLEGILTVVKLSGCAIIWCKGFGLFDELTNLCQELKIRFNAFPLIWNTTVGQYWGTNPFMLSYRLGLFIEMPEYKHDKSLTPIGAVINANAEGDQMPIPLVQYSLDAMCKEGDKVWVAGLPAPLVEVAICGRLPFFALQSKETVEKLKEHYRSIYGKVDFV